MNWIMSHILDWNSWIDLLLYWLPMSLCACGYTIKTACKIREDRARREKGAYYAPSITIGSLAGYVFLTFVPVANLWAAIFDVSPKLATSLISWCERVLATPLVPKRKPDADSAGGA